MTRSFWRRKQIQPWRIFFRTLSNFVLSQKQRNELGKISRKASQSLSEIIEKQRKLKQEIEDYKDNDWENRYGATGLWRKLKADIYTAILGRCEIDFYFAISTQSSQKNKILTEILKQIDSLDIDPTPSSLKFLKAKIFISLGKSNPDYKKSAVQLLDQIATESDLNYIIGLRTAIVKIKLLGESQPNQAEKLAEEFYQSSNKNDFELVLLLAFLQKHLNYPESIEKTVQKWPQTEGFLGRLILSQLCGQIDSSELIEKTLDSTSPFEAELAIEAGLQNETVDYGKLLNLLSNNKNFQRPFILYLAAVKSEESEPAKSVLYLIKASELQKQKKSKRLNIEAQMISKQAVLLAYKVFTENRANCSAALKAFENHIQIAGNLKQKLKYLYSIVLSNCGRKEDGQKLLQETVQGHIGFWRNRAKLDLIQKELVSKNIKDQHLRNKLIKELKNLIDECRSDKEASYELSIEAKTICCRLLLESDDTNHAQEILNILNQKDTDTNARLRVFKSKALQKLNKLDESIKCLLLAIEPNDCEYSNEAVELIAEVVNKIDLLKFSQDNSGFTEMMQNSQKIAEYCHQCFDTLQTKLYIIEPAIFAANKKRQDLVKVEELLNTLSNDSNNLDCLRCRARLFTETGKFEDAGRLWARICKIQDSQSNCTSEKNRWWQAKFYELYCWSKMSQTKKEGVSHTIEVLENSYSDIPEFWAQRLNSLKTVTVNK
ncbi:MAG: hypothetical protein ACYSSI_04075 [Planctomycetota bacterium]